MYYEIGLNLSVRGDTVVGVFDLDNTSWSYRTREFLSRAEENGEITEATDSLPKSFVLTQEYGSQRIYLTKHNSPALQRKFEK